MEGIHMHEIAANGLFVEHQQLLRERLYTLIEPLPPVVRVDVVRALQEPGKLLAVSAMNTPGAGLPAGVWSLLTLLVARHVAPTGDLARAATVAVAVECLLCAFDLFDDIEDGDQTQVVADLGPARTTNTATILLILAFRAVRSLEEQGLSAARVFALLTLLEAASLTATAGQQRDLLSEQRPVQSYSQAEGEEIAAEKAGSLMQFACALGATCGGADAEQGELFAGLGLALGIAHQLDNDAHGVQHELMAFSSMPVVSGVGVKKTDLASGKKTLPVILAWQEIAQEEAGVTDSEKQERFVSALEGGILATWGLCLYYRERARDYLQRIEATRPISSALRTLLGFA
jgi:geranylgeranyl pyrophosphate synthase